MDEILAGDQPTLLDATARFIHQTCPVDRVRAGTYFHDEAVARSYERGAADLGWYSLVVPAEMGGGTVSDNSVVDAALVSYARGRAVQPGPFISTNVVARSLAVTGTAAQRTDLLPALMSGARRAAWAIADASGLPVVEGALRAEESASGYHLSGTSGMVEDPGSDGVFLVAAACSGQVIQFVVDATQPGLRVIELDSLDITRRFVTLRFDEAELPATAALGDDISPDELVCEQVALAAVLLAADSAGAMHADFADALDHAKARIAFGRPIGSFQAVKHALADTSLHLEMSKAVALAAAARLGERAPNRFEVASMAKAFTGQQGVALAQQCFQIFGGMGFMWEHDQHLYLRRLTTNAALLGNAGWHRERLCQLAGL